MPTKPCRTWRRNKKQYTKNNNNDSLESDVLTSDFLHNLSASHFSRCSWWRPERNASIICHTRDARASLMWYQENDGVATISPRRSLVGDAGYLAHGTPGEPSCVFLLRGLLSRVLNGYKLKQDPVDHFSLEITLSTTVIMAFPNLQ